MACSDPKRREFQKVPVNSQYELSVTGPAGFGAFAHFDDGRTGTLETWPFEDISPGPKKKRLTGSGEIHVVFVFVNIDPTKNIAVKVAASVNGKSYCRTVSGKGTQEIIVHTIRMA
jgi:ribosomal protein S1